MINFPLSASKRVNDILFISGQIGQENGQLVSDGLEEQTVQAINNLKNILKEEGLSIKNVIDVTVFLIDQNDYIALNEVYAKEFKEPYPTRTVVTIKSLPLGAKVELKAIAMF